jgi:hypothetical protein
VFAAGAALGLVRARTVNPPAANGNPADCAQEHHQGGEGRERGQLVDQATDVQRRVEHRDQPGHRTADQPGNQTGQQPRHRQITAPVRVGVACGVLAAVDHPPRDHAGDEQKEQHDADQSGVRLPHADQRPLKQANDDHRGAEHQAAQHPVSHGATA